MKTKRQLISDIRSKLKEVSADSMYSNRYLWSEISSASYTLIKRDADTRGRIYKTSGVWTNICLHMISVSPIQCDCVKLPVDCHIYRSAIKLPTMLETSFGIIYKMLSSIDLSTQLTIVSPMEFQTKMRSRFGKFGKYAFVYNGYLWTNIEYPRMILSAIFKESTRHLSCEPQTQTGGSCGLSVLDEPSGIPDYLEEGVKRTVLETLMPTLSKPTDNIVNSSESQREASI